jgi:SAM-dependent methyltransferase
MEKTKGVTKIFSLPLVYHGFQSFLYGNSMEWLIREHWKLQNLKRRVVDIGCGTALLLKYLPSEVEYVGFDVNERYIQQAKKMWAARPNTSFFLGKLKDLKHHDKFKNVDLFICAGVLHHLSYTEADEVLQTVLERLSPGGRFLAHEPCFLAKQSWLHRCVLNMDRGQGIRTELQWKELVSKHFEHWESAIVTGLIRIPYTHILLDAKKSE